MEITQELLRSFQEAGLQITTFAPKLVAAFFFFFLGWFGAVIMKKLTIRFLRLLNTEAIAEKLGIEDFLIKGGVRFTTTTIIANVVFWVFLLFVLLSGFNFIGLPVAASLLNQIFFFIPRLVSAFVILIFGMVLARFLRSALSAYLNNLNVSGADLISRALYFTVITLVAFVAMEALEIQSQILSSAFLMMFGAICLALGLAFGFAGRKMAREILERTFGR